jgi:hypothetical protein
MTRRGATRTSTSSPAIAVAERGRRSSCESFPRMSPGSAHAGHDVASDGCRGGHEDPPGLDREYALPAIALDE